MRRTALLFILFPLALGAAACAKDDTSSASTTAKSSTTAKAAASTTPSGAGGGASVKVASTELGKVLVDADGHTLYAFTPDTATTSTCTGGCASAWPAATTTGTPTADGVAASSVTVIDRVDGTRQIVVAGHPLYTYSGDSAPGDTSGQGTGGKWFVVAADGSLVKAAAATTTTTSAGGY